MYRLTPSVDPVIYSDSKFEASGVCVSPFLNMRECKQKTDRLPSRHGDRAALRRAAQFANCLDDNDDHAAKPCVIDSPCVRVVV